MDKATCQIYKVLIARIVESVYLSIFSPITDTLMFVLYILVYVVVDVGI